MKKVLSLFLGVVAAITLVIPASAKENKVPQTEIKSSIEGIINYKKSHYDEIIGEISKNPIKYNWLVLGLSRQGYKEDYDMYASLLKTVVEDKYKNDPENKLGQPTDFAKVILTLGAIGKDATDFGKDANEKAINLVADGVYNNAKFEKQGLNGLVYGLLALDSKNFEVPEGALYTRDSIIPKILANQTPDGGFAFFGDVADPDMTAMTLQALAKYYNDDKTYTYEYKGESVSKSVKQVFDEGLAVLSKIQNPQGGFTSWGFTSSASAAQVVLAASSVGIDVQNYEPLIKNGNSLIDFIMTFKSADGGFANTVKPGEEPVTDSIITDQILYCLVGYDRMLNGQRNLYDYAEEPNKTAFVIKCGENEYNIPFDERTSEYSLDLPTNATTIEFKNIPANAYDKSNIKANEPVSVKDSITVTLVSRTGETRNYTIKIALSDAAAVKSVVEKINALPEAVTLKDKENIEKILKEYNSLSDSDKLKITNVNKLNKAKADLDKLIEEDKALKEKEQKQIKEEIENLSKNYTVKDLAKISALSDKLSKMEDFADKKALSDKLASMNNEINNRIKLADDLNKRIWEELDPLKITLADKDKVIEFEKAYNALPNDVKDRVTNYQDVIDAKKAIEELENKAPEQDVSGNKVPEDNISGDKASENDEGSVVPSEYQDNISNEGSINTGDNMNVVLMLSLMMISLFGMGYVKKVK